MKHLNAGNQSCHINHRFGQSFFFIDGFLVREGLFLHSLFFMYVCDAFSQ